MNISKRLEQAQFYFEDGAIDTTIDILNTCLIDLKNIKEAKDKLLAEQILSGKAKV